MAHLEWSKVAMRQIEIGPRSRRGAARGSRTRFLPRLDRMEDRALLSTLTVMNNHDSGPNSLRADIAIAKNGDTIDFASSLKGETITLTSGELDITTSLTIDGLGENQLSVSGNEAYRVFEIGASATVTINNLAIASGKAVANNGGGILVDAGGTLSLDHVDLTNNTAYADSLGNYGSGGAIENDGSLTVTDSTFKNNLRPPDLREFDLEPVPGFVPSRRSSRPVASWCPDI